MRIDGGSHCGAIRFEAEIDPAQIYACHCTDCQVLSGAPYRVVIPARFADLRLSGKPKIYTKIAESGRERQQTFCGDCGAPVYSRGSGEDASRVALRWGTVNQRRELAPKRRAWCRSAVEWSVPRCDVPASETG